MSNQMQQAAVALQVGTQVVFWWMIRLRVINGLAVIAAAKYKQAIL